ncbi:hypothetical protein [uncultured Methanobrevibacter sp.]|uniref:hypothetical protein n=1 Tax=uncultured Methanobrevibacter sp. TaxID=253161 RepID=UPI0025D2C534|nr:hypothetical protein [uncultured Methanobrevibacter sp.]
MTKVDCIVELCDEKVEEGFMEGAKKLLVKGFPVDIVSNIMELPIDKVEELKREVESSK